MGYSFNLAYAGGNLSILSTDNHLELLSDRDQNSIGSLWSEGII